MVASQTTSASTSISDLAKATQQLEPATQNALPHISQTSLTVSEQEKTIFKPSRSFILAFASICVVTLASAIDATSLSIALPIVTVSLKGGAIDAFWSGTSFLIASAVAMPISGGLSHVFGRKQVSSSEECSKQC